MKVAEIMTRKVMMVDLNSSLREAAEKMKQGDIGVLPVTDGEKIKGMLTDRDIVLRTIAEGKDPAITFARDAMTAGVKYVYDDEDISEAANAMKDDQIRRLVVLNRDKRLVGLVSLGDLCRQTDDEHLSAVAAKGVSETAIQHQMPSH